MFTASHSFLKIGMLQFFRNNNVIVPFFCSMVYILPLPITDPLSEWEMGGV